MMIVLKCGGIVLWGLGSLSLILSLWIKHRNDRITKKLFWTVILCVPLVGWLFYGGLFNYPSDPSVKPLGEQCSGGLSGRSYSHHPKTRGRL